MEKVVEKIDPSICLGLIEEDMSLEELGEFDMESDNLIFVQKSIGGYLFVDVKGKLNHFFYFVQCIQFIANKIRDDRSH